VFMCASLSSHNYTSPVHQIEATPGHLFFVNPSEFWNGTWQEDSNGWRVQLCVYMQTNHWYPPKGGVGYSISTNLMLSVQWGSAVRNSGNGYYMTPNGKFSKFELMDSKGKVVPPNSNAGANLLIEMYNWNSSRASMMSPGPNQSPPKILYGKNLPEWASPTGGTLMANFPETIATNVYPYQEFAGMIGEINCVTNWPPPYLSFLKLDEVYSITNEGDYTLTIRPVLYKKRIETNILDRVDLPSVATKIHLTPRP